MLGIAEVFHQHRHENPVSNQYHERMGRLLGYPDAAIRHFLKDETLPSLGNIARLILARTVGRPLYATASTIERLYYTICLEWGKGIPLDEEHHENS